MADQEKAPLFTDLSTAISDAAKGLVSGSAEKLVQLYRAPGEAFYNNLSPIHKEAFQEILKRTNDDELYSYHQNKANQEQFNKQSAVLTEKLKRNHDLFAKAMALPESEEKTAQLTNILSSSQKLQSLRTALQLQAQPKTVSERLQNDFDEIINAHDEEKETGVLPKWYTKRKYDEQEISIIKSARDLQSRLKAGVKAGVLLEEVGIDAEMQKAYKLDKDPIYNNAFIELMNNTIMRPIYANRMAIRVTQQLTTALTDEKVAELNPKAAEIVKGKIAAQRRGDIQEVARLNTLLNLQKEYTQIVEAGSTLMGMHKLVIGTPKEVALVDPKYKVTFTEILNDLPLFQIAGQTAKWTDIPIVKTYHDQLDKGQKEKEAKLADLLAIAKNIKDLPDDQLPVIERVVNQNVPRESGRGVTTRAVKETLSFRNKLKEDIDKLSGEITTTNTIKGMLNSNVTEVPGFMLELLSGEGEIKAAAAITKLVKKSVLGVSKTAALQGLKAAEHIGEARFSKGSIFNAYVTAAKDVVEGKQAFMELPKVANFYNEMVNRFSGLSVGAGKGTITPEQFQEKVRDIVAGMTALERKASIELAENYKTGFPDKHAFTDFATKNRDLITLEAKKAGHAAKKYVSKESGDVFLVEQEKKIGGVLRFMDEEFAKRGYEVKSINTKDTPSIDRKNKIVFRPENWNKGMTDTAKVWALVNEFGHMLSFERNTKAAQDMLKAYKNMMIAGQKRNILTKTTSGKTTINEIKLAEMLKSTKLEDQIAGKELFDLRHTFNKANKVFEDESYILAHNEFQKLPEFKDLDIDIPSIKRVIEYNSISYGSAVEKTSDINTFVQNAGKRLKQGQFATKSDDLRYLEHRAYSKFLEELKANKYDTDQTMAKLGIEIEPPDLKTIADKEEFIFGYDALKGSGKFDAITDQLLENPGYQFTPGDKKSIKGVLDWFQKYGYLNKEAGAFDMVTIGYSTRDIKTAEGILGPALEQRVNGWKAPNNKLKFATWQENADYYAKTFKYLNENYLDIQAAYASATASNVAVDKFRKLVKQVYNLDPDKYTPQFARMEDYIARGGKDFGKFSKMWNKVILKPVKIGLVVGHPMFHIRNIADDSFRTLLGSGSEPLRVKNLKEAVLSYAGEGTSRIRLSPQMSLTPAELSEIAWNHGILKTEAVASDSNNAFGAKLIQKYAQTGTKKMLRQAWEMVPLGPEFSTHQNNILRMSTFITELRNELKGGKDFQDAVWKARQKVSTYLIDNKESGAILDFMSNYIPFVRFNAQSFKTYMDVAIKKPEYMYRLNALLYNHSHGSPTEEERKYMAPYMKEMMMMTMGHDKVGNKLYLSRLGLSYEQLNDWISTEGFARTAEKAVAQVLPFNLAYALIGERHPFFGTPYNSYFGSKTYRMFYESDFWQNALGGVTRYPDGRDGVGNPIYRYEFDQPERANKLLGPALTLSAAITYPLMKRFAGESVGAVLTGAMSSRGVSEFAKLSDDNKTKFVRFLNYLTGMKFISVDTDLSKLYKEMDKFKGTADTMIRAQKDLLKAQEMWSKPEDQELLQQFYKEIGHKYKKQLENLQ